MRLTLFVLALVIPVLSSADEVPAPGGSSIELFALNGSAEIRDNAKSPWRALELGAKLKVGDEIHVAENGRAAIQFPSGYLIRLNGNSSIRLDSRDGAINMDSGLMHFFNRSENSGATINTPVVSAAIRGTEGIIFASKKETKVDLFEGHAAISNQYGSVSLAKNESATTQAGQAPKRSLIISRLDSIQWAVSIPDLGDAHDSGETANSIVSARNSLALLASGKTKEAQTSVGSLSKSPSNVLARSYIAQSDGDLSSVKAMIEEGLQLYPGNQNLLARAAEVSMFEGNISEAQKYIEKACAINCSSPHIQVIQGFISLVTNDSQEAIKTFSNVIIANSELSMAYLGRSLAFFQFGNAAEAQNNLLRAISLDPTVAVYRSYLGKMFYELYNESKASGEYNEAIALDPYDPTPYLYRSYLKLSQNNPLGAIEDVENSMAKNGNRAVFRSSLLLDQDEAVRSAALSRIFIESGFTDAARIAATNALIKDPLNFSAHRLLGETQDGIFYADAALSELRVARILAPANSNLNQSAGSQQSLSSFDSLFERNFTRTGVGYTYDGRLDAHEPSVANVGRDGSLAWGLSADSALGDGFKRNNFLRDTLLNGSIDYDLDWDKKLRLEANGRFISRRDSNSADEDVDSTSGGVSLSYVQRRNAGEAFIADIGIDRKLDTVHSPFSERVAGLTQVMGGESASDLDSLVLDQHLYTTANILHSGLQYTVSDKGYSVVVGSQFIHQDPSKNEDSLVLDDSQGLFTGVGSTIDTKSDTDISGHDAYVYTTLSPIDELDFTLGLVRTDIESDVAEVPPYIDETKHDGRFNPKFGIHSQISDSLSVRGTYTESLRKSSFEDLESLEPTLVGGINQRYNDLPGSVSRAEGVGIDWKLPSFTYLGAEYTRRRVTEDIRNAIEDLTVDFDTGAADYSLSSDNRNLTHRLQHLGRAYVHQRLTENFSTSLEYRHGTSEGDDSGPQDSLDDDTVSSSLRWFDPSGLFALVKESWTRQDRTLRDPFPDGTEHAWITDAGIGWRISQRQGKIFLQARNLFNQGFLLDQSEGFREDLNDSRSYIAGFEYNF